MSAVMNSDEIYDALVEISSVSSKKAKEELLRERLKDPNFKEVVRLAYDPFITFGIRDLPDTTERGFNQFGFDEFNLLKRLGDRELTGSMAQNALYAVVKSLTPKSVLLLGQILRKDLRGGFAESTINKCVKGLIPSFPYQRCSLPKHVDLSSWPWDKGVISQEKADGMFCNLSIEMFPTGAQVTLTSRQGTELNIHAFQPLAKEAIDRLLAGFQYHGELVVMVDGKIAPREIGNGILNRIASGGTFQPNEVPRFLVWDMVPLETIFKGHRFNVEYQTRLQKIIELLKRKRGSHINLIRTRIVHSLKEAYEHAGELMRAGKEGTVLKHPRAIWKDGTSKEQVKLKLEFEMDLVIVEILQGRPGTKNEGRPGSLTCQSECGLLVTDVTVKNEDMRDRIEANPNGWIGKIMTVVANDIMKPSPSNDFHSLFLPRFTEDQYRIDKTTADDLTQIFAIKEAAIFGESLKKAA